MPTEGPPLQTAVKYETPASVRPPKWPLWRSDPPPLTVGIDWKRQNIGDKGWTQPDFLREFQKATTWKGGMVRGMAGRAGARMKDKLASFGSIDCTEKSLAQAFNKWKGYYAGKEMSECMGSEGTECSDLGGQAGEGEGPSPPIRLESPAWSAL